jgi:aspartyl-tRNA(Asn)/glutamyl-tRNA(Gln) amidotransferase subunit B
MAEPRVPAFGLETHVELGTATKTFCGCPTGFGAEPNTQTCPVCLGLPGALPVLSGAALAGVTKIALALNCRVAADVKFDRKHYFYPDIPKGFQTSQADKPVGSEGYLDVLLDGEVVRVEVERVHLEEDTGKSSHIGGAGRIHGASHSVLDFNRSGIPLVEIVTKPVVGAKDPAALARAYVSTLVELVRDLGVSEVRLEHGQLRSDVNVSLGTSDVLGTRSETKNVGSTRGVEAAVRFELERHAGVLDAGGVVVQETRHFHESSGTTSAGRLKEDAEDYRYLADPDQPVRNLPAHAGAELKESIPAPALARRLEVARTSGLVLEVVRDLEAAGLLELVLETAHLGVDASAAAAWWTGEAPSREVRPEDAAFLVRSVADGTLSTALARTALTRALEESIPVEDVVERDGLRVERDPGLLGAAAALAVRALPEVAEKARTNPKALGPLLGWVRKNHPELDAKDVREALLAHLG